MAADRVALEDRIWNSRLAYSVGHFLDREAEMLDFAYDWIVNGRPMMKLAGAVFIVLMPVQFPISAMVAIPVNARSEGVTYDPLLQGYVLTEEIREMRSARGSDPECRLRYSI